MGHGSFIDEDGLPGYFGEGDDLVNVESNLIEVLNYANAKFPDLKKILFSHSMGSWIALGVIQKYKNIDLLVLSGSSLIPNKVILSQRKLVSILIAIFGGKAYSKLLDRITIRKNNSFFSPNRTPNDWLSRDVLSVDEYTADDKCGFLVTNSLWLQTEVIESHEVPLHPFLYYQQDLQIQILYILVSWDWILNSLIF